jgi:undecaprenyl-diphosphatase
VGFARAIQTAASTDLRWAEWLTAVARWPAVLVSLLVCALAAGWLGGARAGLLAPVHFAAVWLLDKGLRYAVFQPRPSPDLIHVAGPVLPGSAFPSTSALMYVGTFGYLGVVALTRGRGAAGALIAALCGVLLVFGLAARIVLGAHWPSDVLVSYLYGFVIAGALVGFVPADRTQR